MASKDKGSNTHRKTVFWKHGEYIALLQAEPDILTVTNTRARTALLVNAQAGLPVERQRSKGALYNACFVRSAHFLQGLADAASALGLPGPVHEPQRVYGHAKKAAQAAPKPAPAPKEHAQRVTYTTSELRALAHDADIKRLLDKTYPLQKSELMQAVERAQRRHLRPERWRTRKGLNNCVYRPGAPLVTQLRGQLRFPLLELEVARALRGEAPTPPAVAVAAVPVALPATDGRGQVHQLLDAFLNVAETRVRALVSDLADELAKRQQAQFERQTAQLLVLLRTAQGAPSSLSTLPALPELERDPDSTRPQLPRVDIVGLLNGQADIVKQRVGANFRLRFLQANEIDRQPIVAPHVILLSKFIGHTASNRAKKAGAQVHYANGGAKSVIDQLNILGKSEAAA